MLSPAVCHSHASGNPFFVSWTPGRVWHDRSSAGQLLMDPLSTVRETLKVIMFTLPCPSFPQKFLQVTLGYCYN